MNFKAQLRIVISEFQKSIKIWLAYPILLVFWVIAPLMWLLPFIFQGKALVGGMHSEAFKNLTGSPNYLPFVLIGAMVSTYIFSGLWGVGNSLREETYWGTLEYIIASPASPILVLLGKTLAEFLYASVNVGLQALLATLFLGLNLTITKILPVLVIVLLLVIGFYGFAIAFAGLTLLIKEAHGWVHTIEWVFYLFSPIRYPVEVSPITKTLSALIPLTYALVAIRTIILLNKNLGDLHKIIFILLIMDIVLLLGGYIIFRLSERRTKVAGTLGQY
ncbi:MAG: ABC transporter permease [candidate division WOR-3 bacterium]|nr:ABC transporter permease [candidate division WOR-3 bacterium]MCX7757895.1 ABC transporter permease [candidate division WOR-3 bacterium]MDW7987350.1 ABC transporter permease [candidate division WOR-3 bacterium]